MENSLFWENSVLSLSRWLVLHALYFYSVIHRTNAHMSIPSDPSEDDSMQESPPVYDEHMEMLQINELRTVNDSLNDLVHSNEFPRDLAHHIDANTAQRLWATIFNIKIQIVWCDCCRDCTCFAGSQKTCIEHDWPRTVIQHSTNHWWWTIATRRNDTKNLRILNNEELHHGHMLSNPNNARNSPIYNIASNKDHEKLIL